MSDYWISGAPPGVWAREIAGFPDVTKVDSLAEVGEGSLYRITYRNPPIVGLYDGCDCRSSSRSVCRAARSPGRSWPGCRFPEGHDPRRAVDPHVAIVSIRRRPLRTHLPLLTEAQHQLLNQAIAAGYFAVPRGITLTALARKLERSKPGISEAIALIEKKLFETALRPELGGG